MVKKSTGVGNRKFVCLVKNVRSRTECEKIGSNNNDYGRSFVFALSYRNCMKLVKKANKRCIDKIKKLPKLKPKPKPKPITVVVPKPTKVIKEDKVDKVEE